MSHALSHPSHLQCPSSACPESYSHFTSVDRLFCGIVHCCKNRIPQLFEIIHQHSTTKNTHRHITIACASLLEYFPDTEVDVRCQLLPTIMHHAWPCQPHCQLHHLQLPAISQHQTASRTFSSILYLYVVNSLWQRVHSCYSHNTTAYVHRCEVLFRKDCWSLRRDGQSGGDRVQLQRVLLRARLETLL